MSHTVTTVRPYKYPTKKASANNYQAMPVFVEASNDLPPASGNKNGSQNGGSSHHAQSSPASTWKEGDRKDSESTANLSNASPGSSDLVTASPHRPQQQQQRRQRQLSNLSAQLAAEKTEPEGSGILQQDKEQPETNLSFRDMLEGQAGHGVQDTAAYFPSAQIASPPTFRNDDDNNNNSNNSKLTPLQSLWKPLTPPPSLGVAAQVPPSLNSSGVQVDPPLTSAL